MGGQRTDRRALPLGYPHLADRIEVVRNGFARDSVPIADSARPQTGRCGLVTSARWTSPPSVLTTVIEVGEMPESTDPALKDAVLGIRATTELAIYDMLIR